MDLDSDYPSAPVRYAFDDEESDEELDEVLAPTVTANLTESIPAAQKLTLVVGIHGPASAYLEFLREPGAIVGHISFKQASGNERNQRETKISIQQISSSIVTVAVNEALDRSIVPVFTSSLVSLFASQLERIIVLDSISPAEYISSKWGEDLTPPYLRVLSSSAAPQITKLKQLEQPNIIKDLSAALVSYCEIYNVSCYVLLSLQESYLGKPIITSETLDAYSEGLDAIGLTTLLYDSEKLQALWKQQRAEISQHRLYL
ncbi:hypothetical protein VTP01DRAFT_9793 [Rhizomucor pusillus]|uniref:uncharacterized protein n=1 Tax=Rhizomucor pusillus TaxID=4840 RepID=UPI0037425BB7